MTAGATSTLPPSAAHRFACPPFPPDTHSKQGNRVSNLLNAVHQLPQYGVQVLRVSLLYETAPMHVESQPEFLNAAVLGVTDLSALQLLYNVKQIEKAAGGASYVCCCW